MCWRIGDYVVRGELRNNRANGVHGWIEFAADQGLHLELTGNLKGQLRGKHVRFAANANALPSILESEPNSALPEVLEQLTSRQIGVVGDIVLKHIKVANIPLAEFVALPREQQEAHSLEKNCLRIEWFGQNGHVIAELVDPRIEFVDPRDASETMPEFDLLEDSDFGVGINEVYLDKDGPAGPYDLDGDDDEEDDEDPYGLFGADLDQTLSESLNAEGDFADLDSNLLDEANPEPPAPGHPRSWDEVIPGIDPETKAMYEQWDEIFEGKKDEPVGYLFQSPLKLPPADKVSSDEEAEELVTAILAQLALLSVAVDVCEHYTPRQTYRLLMTEILPTAKVHPNLAASRMVQHYCTSDFCDACEAEFNEEFPDEEE